MSYEITLGSYSPEDAFDIEVGIGINKLRVGRFQLPNPKNKYSGVEEMDALKVSLDSKLLFDGVVDNVEDILKGGDFLGIEGVGKGYKLFNKLQTKEYVDVNGKTIIVDAVNLAGLDPSKVDPDNEIASTFTKEYEKVPAFEIVEEICRESAKATGEVGFYFYIDVAGVVHVYPYDKFTSSFVAKRGENLVSYRRKKLGRTVKNKIWVKGEASKPLPLDKDYAENLTKPNNQLNHADGVWTCAGGGATISMDTITKIVGSYSVKTSGGSASGLVFTWNNVVNFEEYKKLYFQVLTVSAYSYFHYYLEDEVGKQTQANSRIIKEDEFILEKIAVGKKLESEWNFIQSGFDWTKVKKIVIWNDIANPHDFWVDGLHLWGKRWEGFAENSPSQTKFNVREKCFIDDRLLNDADCLLTAKHLTSILKDSSRVIEAEISPANYDLVQGERLRILDVTRNIDEYARILEITHSLGEEKKTTLELSKEPLDWTPLFLDSTRRLELLSKGLERKVI